MARTKSKWGGMARFVAGGVAGIIVVGILVAAIGAAMRPSPLWEAVATAARECADQGLAANVMVRDGQVVGSECVDR